MAGTRPSFPRVFLPSSSGKIPPKRPRGFPSPRATRAPYRTHNQGLPCRGLPRTNPFAPFPLPDGEQFRTQAQPQGHQHWTGIRHLSPLQRLVFWTAWPCMLHSHGFCLAEHSRPQVSSVRAIPRPVLSAAVELSGRTALVATGLIQYLTETGQVPFLLQVWPAHI